MLERMSQLSDETRRRHPDALLSAKTVFQLAIAVQKEVRPLESTTE